MLNETEQWQAVVSRTAQDNFVYGVVSTGVVCRTGCPSRRPREDNVRYFGDIAEAVQAGFRPCKRCIKDENFQRVAAICKDIEMSRDSESGASGSLQQIAAQHALSLRQMQRLFREVLALTPKQYEIQIRFRRFLALLKTGTRVTDAVYAAGFRSSSRMYEQLHRRAGMNAGTYRAGAAGELVMYATRSMDVGEVVIAQTLKGLCFAGFFDQRAHGIAALREEFPHATRVQVEPQQIEPIASAFERAVAGDYSQLQHLPMDVQGTAFQGQVWEAVRQVPVGMRVTYQELAASMRKPKHARAVARALSGNRIALAVPCHRVVPASNSSSGGYRWGAARKTILLDNES